MINLRTNLWECLANSPLIKYIKFIKLLGHVVSEEGIDQTVKQYIRVRDTQKCERVESISNLTDTACISYSRYNIYIYILACKCKSNQTTSGTHEVKCEFEVGTGSHRYVKRGQGIVCGKHNPQREGNYLTQYTTGSVLCFKIKFKITSSNRLREQGTQRR